jgi:hypothetical protein
MMAWKNIFNCFSCFPPVGRTALLTAVLLPAFLFLVSCSGGGKGVVGTAAAGALPEKPFQSEAALNPKPADSAANAEGQKDLLRSLEEFAELERSGSYMQGMGLAESGLREDAGDYAGAVAAAFKELSWAYGKGLVQKDALEQGLENILALEGAPGKEAAPEALEAARGILAFTRERWSEAEGILLSLFDNQDEPDSFAQWMILVCALEQEHRTTGMYGAIRARYAKFPEYWYRGARAFQGLPAAEYAEQCINLAPAGPFAGECRIILAAAAGLKPEHSVSLRSKSEIEESISLSLNRGNPESLEALLPLLSLPENPYTVYALGALRALAALPKFRDYFSGLAETSSGRLADRLAYICRG